MRADVERIARFVRREELIVELAGARRNEPIAGLFGTRVLADTIAQTANIRLHPAPDLVYEVRWPDGRREAPNDDSGALTTALVTCDRALSDAELQARAALDVLQQARKRQRPSPSPRASTVAPAATPPRRGWLRALFARLTAWWSRLFARPAPAAMPMPAPAPLQLPAVDPLLELEAKVAAADARVAALMAERDQRQSERALYALERCRRILARLHELSASPAPDWTALDIGAPEIPSGFVLVLRPSGAGDDAEPPDATLLTSTEPASAIDVRPFLRLHEPRSPKELLGLLAQVAHDRPATLARRVAAALSRCREHIGKLDTQAQRAHDERVRELSTCRVFDREAWRQREEAAAQLPVARQVDQIVHDAAERLEQLLHEVRAAWEERINSCVGLEQLRVEVAAVENSAAHRFSLVQDELRETMTIRFVRLVLELWHPLSQELMRKRSDVARSASPQLEQAFADIRVALPASLESTFGALQAPDVGALLSAGRGIFDPLLRTVAREKRDCIARLSARLDEIGATTARELFAAAVYVSPLVIATFSGLLGELLNAHERWIDARVAEEQLAWQQARVRLAPALALVASLAEQEARIGRCFAPH